MGPITKLHLCCTSLCPIVFHLSHGNFRDASEGRKLIESIYSKNNNYLFMDRAYEDDKNLFLAKAHGFSTVVLPKKNRKSPRFYDKQLYKQRNNIKRYSFRLKRFRRFFTRYDKLDPIFTSTISLAFIFDSLFMWTLPNVLEMYYCPDGYYRSTKVLPLYISWLLFKRFFEVAFNCFEKSNGKEVPGAISRMILSIWCVLFTLLGFLTLLIALGVLVNAGIGLLFFIFLGIGAFLLGIVVVSTIITSNNQCGC